VRGLLGCDFGFGGCDGDGVFPYLTLPFVSCCSRYVGRRFSVLWDELHRGGGYGEELVSSKKPALDGCVGRRVSAGETRRGGYMSGGTICCAYNRINLG